MVAWETYNGPIPRDFVIDHIDGNRSNNKLVNLRAVSQSENMYNAYRNGHSSAKSVVQYTKSGEYVNKYGSLVEATKAILGNSLLEDIMQKKILSMPVAIRSSIERQGTCSGFLWFWEGSDTKENIQQAVIKNSIDPHSSGITAYYPDGSFYKHYDKVKDACADVKCSRSTILRGRNANRLAKGLYWIMDSDDYSINELLQKEK